MIDFKELFESTDTVENDNAQQPAQGDGHIGPGDDYGLRGGGKPGLAINGHGVMYGNTADPMFESYEAGTDPFINLLYTFDLSGKLTGAIINVPCPSQTNEHAWVFHASFWHNVREKLTAKYGKIGVIGHLRSLRKRSVKISLILTTSLIICSS